MATAYVQSKSANANNVTTVSVTFDSSVAVNGVISVGVMWSRAVSLNSVAKSSGTATVESFTLLDNPTDSSSVYKAAMAYAVVSGAGTCTVTATFSAATGGWAAIGVHEVSGCNTTTPLDNASAHALTVNSAKGAGQTASSANITTQNAGCYIFGYAVDGSSSGVTFTAGTGYTRRLNVVNLHATEDQVQASAGSIAATFTVSAYIAVPIVGIMAFKPAGGTQYNQSLTASMSTFSAGTVKQGTKPLTASMSSFAGGAIKQGTHTLAASMSTFSGGTTKRGAKVLAAAMANFAAGRPVLKPSVNKSASMASFTGSQSRQTSHGLAASMASFAGGIARQTCKAISAATQTWSAVLSAVKSGTTYMQSLAASMASFTGVMVKQAGKIQGASLSNFSATVGKITAHGLSASMTSFTGALSWFAGVFSFSVSAAHAFLSVLRNRNLSGRVKRGVFSKPKSGSE